MYINIAYLIDSVRLDILSTLVVMAIFLVH